MISLLNSGTFNSSLTIGLINSLSIIALDDAIKSALITCSNYSFSTGLIIKENCVYANLRTTMITCKVLFSF